MKKFGLVLLMALAAIGFVSAQVTYGAPTAAVSSDNGSVNIQANVLQQVAVDITPTTDATFTLPTAGKTALVVANAYLVSNYRAWEVKVYSANAGELVRDDTTTTSDTTYAESASTASIPYTFNFTAGSGARSDFTTTAFELAGSAPSTGAGYYALLGKTVRNGEPVAMKITIDAENATEFWDAGVYRDTIYVTIATR